MQLMSGPQRQHVLALEVLLAHRSGARQAMVAGNRQQQGFAEQRCTAELTPRHRQQRNDEIEPPILQGPRQIDRQAFTNVELEIGVSLVQRGQHVRQQVGPNRRRQPQTQQPSQLAPPAGGEHTDFVRITEHPPCDIHHLVAERRHHHLRPAAFDQLHAKAVFEHLQLLAQGRLSRVAALRRPLEMQRVGNSHQVFKLSQMWHVAPVLMVSALLSITTI